MPFAKNSFISVALGQRQPTACESHSMYVCVCVRWFDRQAARDLATLQLQLTTSCQKVNDIFRLLLNLRLNCRQNGTLHFCGHFGVDGL